MNFTTIAAGFSIILGIYCTVPYVRAILAGRTKPHQFSWLVFTIMNGIVFTAQYLEGARASVLISLTFFLGSFIILLLSFRYGTRDTSRWDKILFGLALATIVLWVLTRSNELAIWLTLVIDVAATSMIILKIKKDHASEDPKPWVLATIAYVFACLSLAGTPLGILYVRPIYGMVGDMAIIAAVYYYRRVSRSQKNDIAPLST